MNILVIGNGFDLAHGLPTTYQDFLKFTDSYISYKTTITEELLQEVKNLVNNNGWIKYFKNYYDGRGWIDFEREISNVIQMVDKAKLRNGEQKQKGSEYIRFNFKEIETLVYFNQIVKQGTFFDMDPISEINKCMQRDLNNLIRCLEIYLDAYINQFSVELLSPDIQKLTIDKVLSFNYTNTFARLYNLSGSNNIEYDYIHGKADIHNTIETNNMVLGIDEYLPDDRKSKDVEFIAFKKYYQRIYKETGCKYKEWIDEIKQDYFEYENKKVDADRINNKYEPDKLKAKLNHSVAAAMRNLKCCKHNLYIFGHSLNETDGDILRELILNDNVHTTIYYHNKEAMGQQIANLVKVIRQDELIRRTGGNTKTIEFKQQQDMVPIEGL